MFSKKQRNAFAISKSLARTITSLAMSARGCIMRVVIKLEMGLLLGIIRLGAGFGDPNPGNPEDFFEPEPGIEINTSCPLPPFPFEGPPPKPKKLSKFAKSLRNSVSRLPFWGDRLTKIQKEHGSV